jgi:holo-[acyl-carrier protein] synthase
VIGIGTDVVEIDRFRAAMSRQPGIADRVFCEAERAYAEQRHDPIERYAARFAAKEAVMKALGVGLGSFPLRDVEVVRAPSGAPSVRLHRRAAEVAAERGVTEWRLTLSHSERSAHAVAVAL